MATAVQSPIQEFLAKLRATDEKSANIAAASFAKGDLVEFSKAISGNEAIIPEGYNTDSFLDAAQKEWNHANPLTPEPTDHPQSDAHAANQTSHKEHAPTDHGGHLPHSLSKQTQTLHAVQEEALLKQFEEIQQEPDEDKRQQAIKTFIETHLDAASLIQGQKEILTNHIQMDTLDNIKKRELEKTFEERADKERKRRETRRGKFLSDRQKKRDQEFVTQLGALKDPNLQRRLLREHIQRRQINIYYDEYYDYGEFLFHNAFSALRDKLASLGQQTAPELESTETEITPPSIPSAPPPPSAEEQPTAVPNTPSFPNLPHRNNSRKGGPLQRARKAATDRLKNAAKNATKKAIKEAAKKLLFVIKHFLTKNPWVIVIAVIVLIAATIIVIICSAAFGGNGDSSTIATLPPACSPSSNCIGQLKAFGINLSGDLSENGDPNGKAVYVYQTLELLTQSPSQFGKLLGLPDNQVNIIIPAFGCYGHAEYSTIKVWWCGDNALSQFMIAHELGHVLAFRNHDLYMKFYNSMNWATHPLNTFNCNYDYGYENGPYPGECWADMVGEYLVYKQWRDAVRTDRRTGGLTPPGPVDYPAFPTEGSPTGYYYNFAQQNIFGGLQY